MSDFPAPIRDEGIMPSQWADVHRSIGGFTSERRLWATAFELAIEDWRRSEHAVRLSGLNSVAVGRTARVRAELEVWFASDETCPRSFRWYCDVLNLDCGALRARLASGALNPWPRKSPVTRDSAIQPITPREYARRYREKNAERLRKYNTEWSRRNRA